MANLITMLYKELTYERSVVRVTAAAKLTE